MLSRDIERSSMSRKDVSLCFPPWLIITKLFPAFLSGAKHTIREATMFRHYDGIFLSKNINKLLSSNIDLFHELLANIFWSVFNSDSFKASIQQHATESIIGTLLTHLFISVTTLWLFHHLVVQIPVTVMVSRFWGHLSLSGMMGRNIVQIF